MRGLAWALLSLMIATPVAAHDFWIQPRSWQAPTERPLPFSLEVGHGRFREKWAGAASRIVALRDFSAAGSTDLKPLFRPGGAAPHFTPTFRRPGLHVVAMVTNNTPSDLPAIRFNDFLKEEGLTPAIEHRRRTGTSNRPGRERFSRRAKALIQVGEGNRHDDRIATRPLGISLEIVPLRNPYALGADRRLPVQVLFERKPLPGALIKLTNLDADEKPVATIRTNRDGRALFRIPASGNWLLNVVWTKPVVSPTEEFETTFSSLTFGLPRRPR